MASIEFDDSEKSDLIKANKFARRMRVVSGAAVIVTGAAVAGIFIHNDKQKEARTEQVETLAYSVAEIALANYQQNPQDWKLHNNDDSTTVMIFSKISGGYESTGLSMTVQTAPNDEFDAASVQDIQMWENPAQNSAIADYYVSLREDEETWTSILGYELQSKTHRPFVYYGTYSSAGLSRDEFTALANQAKEELRDVLNGNADYIQPAVDMS